VVVKVFLVAARSLLKVFWVVTRLFWVVAGWLLGCLGWLLSSS